MALDIDALVERARDEVAGYPIGSGYYSMSIGVDDATEIARTILPEIVRAVTAEMRALHPDIHGECHMCSDECGPKVQPCPTVRLCDQIDAAMDAVRALRPRPETCH